MWEQNNGTDESNILQNQFTAYLATSLHRKKIQYLQARYRQLNNEIPLDLQENRKEYQSTPDMTAQLPIMNQLESQELWQALKHLKRRDLKILTMKILEDRSFKEISNETGISYKTVASIYYRLIQKLYDELGGRKK